MQLDKKMQLSATVAMALTVTLARVTGCDARKGTSKVVYRAHRLESIYSLVCTDDSTLEDLPLLNSSSNLKFVWIIACPPPRNSYAAALRALNIHVDRIKTIHLTLYTPLDLNSTHFTGLSITELEVDNYNAIPDRIDASSVKTLHKLTFWGNLLSLPRPTYYQIVKLGYGASSGKWEQCEGLKELELKGWEVSEDSEVADEGWLARCSNLRELKLVDMSTEMIRRALTGVGGLYNLTVHTAALTRLSESLLAGVKEIRQLDLSYCKLNEIHRFALPPLLEEVNLSNNNLWNMAGLLAALAPLRVLRTLHLNENYALNFCAGWTPSSPPVAPLLEHLSLRHTKLQWLDCFGYWESLKVLDVNRNEITVLELDNLPSPKSSPLLVDLRDNDIQEIIPNTEDDYKKILARYMWAENVTVLVNVSLDCDCRLGWAARALRELAPRLALAGARCAGGGLLLAAPRERLDCDKQRCQNCTGDKCEGCVCRRAWRDRALEADCRAARRRAVPRVPHAAALLARDNRIDSLHADDFPATLLRVDLRDNQISRADANATAALFAERARSVLLAGNPLACDCDNHALLAALSAHRSQVEDYDNITCAGTRRMLLDDVALDELCEKTESKSGLVSLLGALLVTISVALSLSISLCCRYKRQIKVFLFTHGCCQSYLRDEDLDEDREYDAFVSFCHEDYHFVHDHILPPLQDYKLCIHYRDWIAGEWISAQISRSIERSSRTIIILTRNFLDSVWGMLEFRMAFATTRQGRPRLVVVVVDDVLDDPRLDAELRTYLATNTYVRWGEMWFWDKLRFALPHRPKRLHLRLSPSAAGCRPLNEGHMGGDLPLEQM